jgi:hypothetical protein
LSTFASEKVQQEFENIFNIEKREIVACLALKLFKKENSVFLLLFEA